jgi:hypothetical protein
LVASADIQKDNKSGYGRIQKDINGYRKVIPFGYQYG